MLEEVAAVEDLVIGDEVDPLARPLVQPAPGHIGLEAGHVGLQRLVHRVASRVAYVIWLQAGRTG